MALAASDAARKTGLGEGAVFRPLHEHAKAAPIV
jgi:hypothetical protein